MPKKGYSQEIKLRAKALWVTGRATDQEIEVHLKAALAHVLEQKIAEMQRLHDDLRAEVDGGSSGES